jgi:TonB family protein
MTLEILLNGAVRMLLFGAVVWLALRAIRVRSPHAETLVWRLVLLASCALPVLLYWRLAPDFTTSVQLPVIAGAGEGIASLPAPGASLRSFAGMLLAIYLAGALYLLGRFAAGLAGMRSVAGTAQRLATPDDVRVSARIASPATFGTVILLPSEATAWPADKLDAVLLHERAHVRGRDGYWSWLARLHTALFWFSPLAWWLQRRLEQLAETTSDDAVVAARHDPVAYAALLLDFSRHPNSRSVVMSVAESNVSGRIERLLSRTPPARALPRVARWAAAAMMIPAVVLAASTTRAEPTIETAVKPTRAGVYIMRAPDPDSFYPVVAKHEKVTGSVVVEVDLDALGQVVDARVVKAEPADPRYGFADAALQVARGSTFENTTHQAASMRFMVKFALTSDPPK